MNNKLGTNFILFWISQTVSQLGSSMTSFALIIWAFTQTQSVMTVSLLTFFSYLPYIIMSVFAGHFVDKYKKKTIILCADSMAALCTVTLACLLILSRLQIWHVYVVNLFIGISNAFQSPSSSVAIGLMVPKNKLSNASGMNSFSTSLLSVITPMLASFIFSFWGLIGIITIDIVSFLYALCVLMFFIRIPEVINNRDIQKTSIFIGCKKGFRFLWENKALFYLIISMAVMNFFSRLTYENILPAMILARSGGNNFIYGCVSGIIGAGGIIGGLIVSAIKLPKNPVRLIYFSATLSFVLGDLLMGVGQSLWLWCFAGLAASVPIPFIDAGQNVILYTHIPQEMQGRVFAVRNALQYVTVPIGILLGGFLAQNIFEPFMESSNVMSLLLQRLVGSGVGSGMAVMFLCTGIIGGLICIVLYKNKHIKDLEKLQLNHKKVGNTH